MLVNLLKQFHYTNLFIILNIKVLHAFDFWQLLNITHFTRAAWQGQVTRVHLLQWQRVARWNLFDFVWRPECGMSLWSGQFNWWPQFHWSYTCSPQLITVLYWWGVIIYIKDVITTPIGICQSVISVNLVSRAEKSVRPTRVSGSFLSILFTGWIYVQR